MDTDTLAAAIRGPLAAMGVRVIAKLIATIWKQVTPRSIAETLDEEFEKGAHIRHAIPTMR